MTENVDCVVIGAGVVGLAVARSIAQAGREVIILEKADAFGTGMASAESNVHRRQSARARPSGCARPDARGPIH